jgi:D-beta-D-heptose 7-phosphate kinase/D-beta-D-heptose 1-phosphate adenosyltransferase
MERPVVVAVSGGFDPLHIGHVRYLKRSRELGDRLVVILNNDNWLRAKKGFAFMPEEERKEILEAIAEVDEVIISGHAPGDYTDPEWRSVARELEALRPHIFANGGDRKPEGDPVPEVAVCERFGIRMIYNMGDGGKVQSSSWLTGNLEKRGGAA